MFFLEERELEAEQVETINILYNFNHVLPKDFLTDQVPNDLKVPLSPDDDLVGFSVSRSHPTSLAHHISVQAASVVWDQYLKIMCWTVHIKATELCHFVLSKYVHDKQT